MLLKQKAALIEQAGMVFQTKVLENRNCLKKKKRMMYSKSSLVVETLEILFYVFNVLQQTYKTV